MEIGPSTISVVGLTQQMLSGEGSAISTQIKGFLTNKGTHRWMSALFNLSKIKHIVSFF